jgi:hypothetical protein
VFKEFFIAGSRMPPHPVLAGILLKFQLQLHQLTPNTIAHVSKYVWAVVSLGGIPSTDGFAKRYELHYQPKKIDFDGAIVQAQFRCINFHVKHYGGVGARLMVVVKNKWSAGWTRAWFYCKVPLI